MKRETTNAIRYVLEELLPPVLRDSRFMRWVFRRHWGTLVDDIEQFRAEAHRVTDDEYAQIYSALPRVQEGTDNSEACIARIIDAVGPGQVIDIGCGPGVLLERIIKSTGRKPEEFAGVDFQVDPEARQRLPEVSFHEAKIEKLPFADASFDTVICTHVLEHILDIRSAVAELRRICRGTLIVVVPKEREYRFTFNPHLHFFAYRHSFLRHMLPLPAAVTCEQVGRDFFYVERVAEVGANW
jgi:SAM-dependent methyltransferase